ncbi:hypothetical protein [uncultured Bartonella sp.]|uniref:hypothetical protein n=1 Tax=uncultured Bartonella sp. TaxID=104108 RepID=UPI0025F00787|nr:hypothetical protein [uncultured Bartonella sp.]
MSNNTKKQTNKYVSRWFSNASLDGDFSSISKPFLTRGEAYDYTKRVLDDPENTSMPFATIWERKYPLLNLADGVERGVVFDLMYEIEEQLNARLTKSSSGNLNLPWADYSTEEQKLDLLKRIKKTIAAWQKENNITIPAHYPNGWCAGDGVETVVSNWSDRKWPASDKSSKAEETAK